jgi:type II secretory pathway component GspD/PulD (secretin)
MTHFMLAVIFAWSFFGKAEPAKPAAPDTEAITKAAQAAADKAVKELTVKAVKEAAEKAAADAAAAKEAKEHAEKLRLEAKEQAEKLRIEARADAEKMRAEARADAEKSRAEAKEARAKEEAEAEASRKQIDTRIFRLAHASAEEVAECFNKMWSGDFGVTWKVTKMAVAFPESNSIMVTAPRIILDACEKSIRDLDVEAQQVYIEARFVELSNNASHKLGIDWQMLDGMKGSLALDAGWNERKIEGVSSYNSADGSYKLNSAANDTGRTSANLSYINGTIGMSELALVLRALESTEDAKVFSNPKIIVSSGKKAKVDMTEKYPNVTISAKRTTGTSDSLDLSMNMAAIPGEDKFMFAKEAFFSWGIDLEVTPRINTNGLINVSIVPTISSRTDWVTAGASDTKEKGSNAGTYSARYPVINVQRLITEFNMQSEMTAVIGGLSRTIETQKDNGIPWLRDIWWIGPKIFGSKVRVKEQREILVFVTVGLVNPRVINENVGLPKNAVLGRQYTLGQKLEPGDRPQKTLEGIESLDMRLLEEQAKDPLRKHKEDAGNFKMPFTKEEKGVK